RPEPIDAFKFPRPVAPASYRRYDPCGGHPRPGVLLFRMDVLGDVIELLEGTIETTEGVHTYLQLAGPLMSVRGMTRRGTINIPAWGSSSTASCRSSTVKEFTLSGSTQYATASGHPRRRTVIPC